MRIASISILSLAGTVLAAPAACAPPSVPTTEATAPRHGGHDNRPYLPGAGAPGFARPSNCLDAEWADKMADVFRMLIQEYSDELALSALTEDFVDWSSAVNIIMNKGAQFPKNITGPTFSSRQAFMDGQGSQPQIPFTKLNTFYGCDSVSLRWMTARSANGQAREVAAIPVIGNAIIEVVPNNEGGEYKFRIKNLYSEFNAAAWLVNLGVFVPSGPVTPIGPASGTNTTAAKRSIDFDQSLRGAMI